MTTLDTTLPSPAHTGPRTYGGYREERSPGIFGLGLLPSLFLGLLVILTLLTTELIGLLPGLITLTIGAAAVLAIRIKDPHGGTFMSRAAENGAGLVARRTGANLHLGGPFSPHPWGSHGLPGAAADTELHQVFDSYDRPCALLKWNATGDVSLIFRAEPEGLTLVDSEDIDRWVANYGAWLASLGDLPGLTHAAVIIETSEDTGERLRARLTARIDPVRGHPRAVEMLRESGDTFPTGTPQVTAWMTLTFTPPDPKAPIDVVGADLAPRIAALAGGLADTGAGAVRPISPGELCEEMLVCFDPAKQLEVDAAHARGEQLDLSWQDIGPVRGDAQKRYWAHDSGASITWSMTAPPRGVHYSSLLTRLLEPKRGLRTRVAFHYQVMPPWKAARQVERDVLTTEFTVKQTNKPPARAIAEMHAARQTADEEARGAALLLFGLQVTATVVDTTTTGPDGVTVAVPAHAQLKLARSAIGNVAPSVRIRLREQYWAQDSGFLGTCPVGFDAARHAAVPTGLKELTR